MSLILFLSISDNQGQRTTIDQMLLHLASGNKRKIERQGNITKKIQKFNSDTPLMDVCMFVTT